MTDAARYSGLLVILSSPSGAGKSSLAKRLLAADPNMAFSVSATTRAPRPGEVDGREYHFRSKDAFDALVAAGGMLEWAEVFGNCYGTPRAPVVEAISAGQDVVFDVDWQGGQQIKASDLNTNLVSIFILPPSIAELERRLRARGQDSDAVVASRMEKAWGEISHWDEYDYVLVNDDLDACAEKLTGILQAERRRRVRQPGLTQAVESLRAEVAARGISV